MKSLLSILLLTILFSTGCHHKKGIKPCPCDCDLAKTFKEESTIRFIATADPQFFYQEMNPDWPTVIEADRIGNIIAEKICFENYRGAVISGDLTHCSMLEEFERYHQFIRCFKPLAFDGLGNHDFSFTGTKEIDFPQPFIDFEFDQIIPNEKYMWEEESLVIWNEVRSRKRIPAVNSSYPNIHYSWDWEEVHFVQLNVFPGDTPVKYKAIQNPFKSLSFLKEDLKKHVGNSGRPVVLAHHYGLDNFSLGVTDKGAIDKKGEWWTAAHRQAYWDAIKPYNVIAIFTGHAHYCQSECYLPWDGTNVGESEIAANFIPTFTSGAAREGNYLDCKITEDSLVVKRFVLGELNFEESFSIKRKIRK